MVKEIPLTQGKVALVDAADYESLSQHNWYCVRGYAGRRRRKADGSGGQRILMHQVILGPIPEGFECDHIDRNRLNNQRRNLRLATRSQNQANKALQKNNTSGFKGVWHDGQARPWRVRIRVNGQRIYLGRFDDVNKAARAYDAAAVHHYGEFANLNFPDEG